MVKSKCLVLGHQGIRVNEKADEYEVSRSFLDEDKACNEVLIPLLVAASGIDDWAEFLRTDGLQLAPVEH